MLNSVTSSIDQNTFDLNFTAEQFVSGPIRSQARDYVHTLQRGTACRSTHDTVGLRLEQSERQIVGQFFVQTITRKPTLEHSIYGSTVSNNITTVQQVPTNRLVYFVVQKFPIFPEILIAILIHRRSNKHIELEHHLRL